MPISRVVRNKQMTWGEKIPKMASVEVNSGPTYVKQSIDSTFYFSYMVV